LKRREDLRTVNLDVERGAAYIETNPDSELTDKLVVKRCITPAPVAVEPVSPQRYPILHPYFLSAESESGNSPKACCRLQQRSRLFKRTGGVHNAALAQGEEILIFQEDIGRHNTLDKIHGQCFLEEIPRDDKMIIFSGRISSEILLKTARMRVPILISRSAPTDLALN